MVTADDGQAALDLLAEEQVDLVLLDLDLPRVDGQTVIERFHTWSETPVIVLSVTDGQDAKVAALDAGADDYVTKPFPTKELLARMRAVMRRATSDQFDAPSIAIQRARDRPGEATRKVSREKPSI